MERDKDCIFCKIAKGEIKSEVIAESNNFFAIKDIKPKTEGHALIISKKHFVTLLDLPNNLGEELLRFTKQVASNAISETKAHGFNVVMNNLSPAGQIIMHAHLHILPRKENDGFRIGV